MNVEELVLKYALMNAYAHGGKANPKAVIGKVLGENPGLRPKAKEIIPLVNEIVERVNGMNLEEQEARLREVYPEFFEEKKTRKGGEKKGLPPLPKAEKGKVVTRFAPQSRRCLPPGQREGRHPEPRIREALRRKVHTPLR